MLGSIFLKDWCEVLDTLVSLSFYFSCKKVQLTDVLHVAGEQQIKQQAPRNQPKRFLDWTPRKDNLEKEKIRSSFNLRI